MPGATKFVPIAANQTRRIAEVEVRLLRFSHAHTAADLALWLPASRVAIVGDLVLCGYYPHAEFEDGGSYQGLLAAIRTIQALRPKVVVGGHGNVCSGPDLDLYIDHLAGAIDRGAAAPRPPYKGVSTPFRTISSQEKVVRRGKLERERGPWAEIPVIDPDASYLESDAVYCR